MVQGDTVLTRLRGLDARCAPYAWDWAEANAGAIERHWHARRAAQPALFDGPVLLCHECRIRDGLCEVGFFETRFSRFLALREAGWPDPSVTNAFAAIVPHAADGAVLLGEMAPHTANAGQVYFPCGTPDRDDVRGDGRVDLAGSAARELAEETGLALPPATDSEWLLVRAPGQRAFLRPVRFAQDAAGLIAGMRAHAERQAAPELARIVAVRRRGEIDPDRMPAFVRTYLAAVLPG